MVVRFAENGREAIESLDADAGVDLVLMDVMMPEMDGHETTRALRADAALRRPADHRADGQGDEGRPREVDRRRRVGLHHQARRHRTAHLAHARVALRVSTRSPSGSQGTGEDDHDDARERLEIDLLLEAIQRRYGYDFRGYALASLRRRLWHRVYAEGLQTLSGLQERILHEPGVHGPPAARPVDQRHGDVPRPELLPRAARARLPAAAHVSLHPRLERRLLDRRGESTRWRSRCARRVCSSARASTRRTSTTRRCSARRAGSFPLERMQRYTENYLRAGGHRGVLAPTTPPTATARASTRSLVAGIVLAQHNLVTDGSFNEFHLIVCRNVMIYFGRRCRRRSCSCSATA